MKKVSERAQQELVASGQILEEDKKDVVSALKAGFKQLNKTCDDRLHECQE